MAFDDLPQIDEASENDDEAKTYFARAFGQKAGFIPREQSPDKGCDYFTELIENKNATNWHFGVQLKSIENPDFINNGNFISYSWHTSRLGYLMRSAPIYGLLILYDVFTKKTYYEYIDQLYLRLMERDNDKWKQNDQVSVHVPVANLLDEASLKSIHQTFINRHNNLARMTSEQAVGYDLPVVKMNLVRDYNLNKIEDVVEVLKRWGISSIMLNDLPIIYELISKVPNNEILKDKELSILAALANNEAGKIAESTYYIERLLKRFQLTGGEEQMIQFIKLKNEHSLGIIGPTDFIGASKVLLNKTFGEENQITLRLNIVYFELIQIKAFQAVPIELADEISELAEKIDKLEASTSKYYLKIWNLENLALLISHVRVEGFNEMSIRDTFERPLSLHERLEMAQRIVAMQRLFMQELNTVDIYAKAQENYLLQAFAIHALTRFQLSIEIDMITFSDDFGDLDEREKRLTHEISLGEHGFLVFIKNNLISQAYNLLCLTYELSIVAIKWYYFTSPVDLDKIQQNLLELETELERIPYQSAIEKLISKKRNKDENIDELSGMKGLLLLNREQMENLADVTLRTGRFPNAKKEYLMHELTSFKMFFERCTDPNVYPLVIKPPIEQAYTFPLTFELNNKKTGLVSLHNSDMDLLLSAWGF